MSRVGRDAQAALRRMKEAEASGSEVANDFIAQVVQDPMVLMLMEQANNTAAMAVVALVRAGVDPRMAVGAVTAGMLGTMLTAAYGSPEQPESEQDPATTE